LLVLPLVGVLPVLLAPSALAKYIAFVVTILEFLLSADSGGPSIRPQAGSVRIVAPAPQWGINAWSA
jgi:hypothetical protein